MRGTRQLAIVLMAAALVAAGCLPLMAQGRIDVEAVAGEPFGVGRITFEMPAEMLPQPLGIEGIGLAEKHNRVLYPALDSPALGKLMRDLLDEGTPLTTGGPVREAAGGILRGFLDRPPRNTLYFLFRGNEPLELSLLGRTGIRLSAVPIASPIAHRRLMQLWWRQYSKPPGLLAPKPDYPPVVDTYLTSMLARRLNFRLPEKKQTPLAYESLRKELGLNLGTESLRMAMMQDRMLGLNNLGQPADRPLPAWPDLPALPEPPQPGDVRPVGNLPPKPGVGPVGNLPPKPGVGPVGNLPPKPGVGQVGNLPPQSPPIEPMAMHVPAECFYVRFGSFANFLWLQDTLDKWGGDVQNLIALRGLDHGMNGRIERQLVLKQTVLSRMLGHTVIADVALVGADMFFREGAAYGFLFQARNNLALGASFAQQRSERLAAGGVKEEKVKIGGRDVSYLSSPDGSVRSYYVVDGDYHFVATSKRLVARFLAAGSGGRALGAMPEFRHARAVMPLSREDTIWVYLSPAFFHNLIPPAHRVEMARRLQATADIELVELAKLTAASEGRPGETIEKLMSAGLLPPEFGPLPDGSRVVITGGEVCDSLRGHRGAFLPVGDVPVEQISAAEADDFHKFIEFYNAQWGQMDPLMAGLKRTALKDNREEVVADVLMSPLRPQHFDLLKQWLGPAAADRLAPVPGNMAELELVGSGQRIFGGVCDVGPPARSGATSLLSLGRLRDFLVGYIGTDGELGPLQFLNLGIPPRSDPAGYAISPLGGWRRQYGPFTVFSFQRDVLDAVVPQLHFEPAKRPAQIRLRIGDVANARITPTLNDLAYARTRETSLGNLRLLHALDQQLHVPPAACREAAEFLLGAKLICPLGGKYLLSNSPDEPAHWTSTMLGQAEPGGFLKVHAPQGYQAPPLSWFRGLDLEATMTEKTISAHADIIMQMPVKK